MTRSELQRFADNWNYMLGRVEKRNAPEDRIAAVRTRAAEDVNFLLVQRRDADREENSPRGRTIFRRQADALNLFVELYANAVGDKCAEIENLSRLVFGNS
ncbi:hypothetical protein [Rhizobium sp. CF142]|uniref:hypothetical protein n=1 Tax=Rhizobium sp. CF142 TaxID=1144314 RepID=UPI00026F0158|nr:hypothetical protein [Rhizobium sp. CF142]EJJ26258.1 hypothetical protein PMI11_05510 [Rhizobium sp. CF142]